MHNKKVFTRLDLHKGYWQIKMHEKDIPKTAMTTPKGLFEYLRMPFGLKNAPNTFQRYVDTVLRGLKNTFVYIDDILIASENEAQHKIDVLNVFNRIKEYNLIVSLKKSEFNKKTMQFLGFEIDKNGSDIPKKRVEAIENLELPATPKGLQKVLGAINFYRRYIHRYADTAAPLYKAASLQTTHKKMNWDETIKIAF